MNQVMSLLKSVLLRVTLSLFLVAATFLVSATLGYGTSLSAQAEPLTPEATQYQVDSPDSPFKTDAEGIKDQAENAAKNTQDAGNNLIQKLENAGDTIREKLNLDQPLYPGTKEVLDDAADAITGNND